MGWIEEHQEREVEKQRKRFYFGDEFSRRLEIWKRKNHKSEKDFAQAIGVHPNMVTKWKQGRSFPQAANMKAICAELKVHESEFNPFTDFENDYVKNAGRKEMSRYLQMYADENGFDEDFYSWLIKQPDFVRVFPFHSIEDDSSWQNVILPEASEEHPDAKDFPLLKFEFEDDYGTRKMMNKEDIDFILNIQEDAKRFALPVCLAEKAKVKRKRVEYQLEHCALDYYGIDIDEVKRKYFGTDFIREEFCSDTEDYVKEIIKEVAKEHGIMPRIDAKHIWPAFHPDAVAQRYRDQGYSEEEITEKVEQEREAEENIRQRMIEQYKREGYIIEGEENENG